MKRFLIFLMTLLPMVATFAAKPDKQVVVLTCDIHCQGCCDKIMKNIAFEKGVKDIVCDLKTKTVTVTYDANKTDIPTLLKAFDKIGKPAKVNSVISAIAGENSCGELAIQAKQNINSFHFIAQMLAYSK